MLTLKLKIKKTSGELLDKYIRQYTGLFYTLYNHFELSGDKSYEKKLLEKFDLFDASMFGYCVADVKARLDSFKEIIDYKKKEIESITGLLAENDFKTKRERRTKFRLIKKLAFLKRTLDKNICFGSKALLRKITKAKQEKNPLYDKYLKEYREKRKIGIYLIGNSEENGSRKVRFDLKNNKITFAASKKNHIEIEFYSSKNRNETLIHLDEMADENMIPITVRIDNSYVYLTYDEEQLAGYAFDEKEFKRHLKKNKITDKDQKKQVSIKFIQDQIARKLKGKVGIRFASVDINPYEIGLVIANKLNDSGDFKVLMEKCYRFKGLSNKLGVASTDEEQEYQNNKRKHEICEIWNEIFGLINHYKCAYFIHENLDIKSDHKEKDKEFNRLTKNVWHRKLTTELITKHCNINGIIRIGVNPQYSSFIGNMIHPDYDCIAAALELLRRGIIRFKKGSKLYPSLTGINQEKLVYLLGENIGKRWTWRSLYNFISSSELRYRNKKLNSYSAKNMASKKSKVLIYKKAA